MLRSGTIVAALVTLGAGPAVRAAPTLDIRGAAVRIVIVPEVRRDISITVVKASVRLPIKIHTFGKNTFITGDVGHRVRGCPLAHGARTIQVRGRDAVTYDDLPLLIARMPMDVRVNAAEAIFGDVGRGANLDLTNRGCGHWTIANVAGRARINQAGSGVIHAGGAGEADLSVAGSGDIHLQAVRGGVTAVSSEAGDIDVASLQGPLNIHIAGSGRVHVADGVATQMTASIAGSGGVDFGGAARSLHASIAGSGGVRVARVDGPVIKHVFGAGEVTIGR